MKLSELLADGPDDHGLPHLLSLPEDAAGHTWEPAVDGWVCETCVANPSLFAVSARDVEAEESCMFCKGRAGPEPLADLGWLVKWVYGSLLTEFVHPEDADIYVPVEVMDFMGESSLETADLIHELGEPLGDELLVTIGEQLERDWVKSEGFFDPLEKRILDSWEEFARDVLSGPRFLLNRDQRTLAGHSLDEVLNHLGVLASHLQSEFVVQVPQGQRLYRARPWESDKGSFSTTEDLGSPPGRLAGPQRLSAAGVSCFYAAEEAETAIAETRHDPAVSLTIGTWETGVAFRIVDLSTPRAIPSIFDPVGRRLRGFVRFLNGFRESINKPRDEELGAANSYLPSQIFAEYLRFSLPTSFGQGVDGVRYSSDARPGGVNWCLFDRPDRADSPLLALTGYEHHRRSE